MALQLDLAPDDIIIVPPDSGAQIRVVEKSGRRVRVAVESAKPVQVLRARDERPGASAVAVKRPQPTTVSGVTKPRA